MIWLAGGLALAAGWLAGLALVPAASWLLARRPDTAGRPYVPPPWPYAPAAVTALTCGALVWRYGVSLALVPAVVAAWLLLLIALIDLDRRMVLNELLWLGLAVAAVHAAGGGLAGLLAAAAGGALALVLFGMAALLGRGALGAGDVKLAVLLGLYLGFPVVLQALFLGVLLGGVVAGVLLVTRRVRRDSMIPYAPFLAAGGILGLLLR